MVEKTKKKTSIMGRTPRTRERVNQALKEKKKQRKSKGPLPLSFA